MEKKEKNAVEKNQTQPLHLYSPEHYHYATLLYDTWKMVC